jgi:predicted nucleotidyltransferase
LLAINEIGIITVVLEVIKSVYERKDEERERARESLMSKISNVLKRLEVSFEEVYVFGSVTKPYQFGESSDVDIAFKGLDKERFFSTISFLNRELGRDVNVVLLEEVHFKEKIIREGIRWKRD